MSDGRSKIELASYKGKRLNPAVKVLLALILLGALVFGGLLGLVLSGSHDAVQGNPQVMVVLGCQVKPWGPSVLLQDRLDKALEYLEDHPGMTVVVSAYLVQKGVAPEQIIQEALSHNTFQNMTYSARHLKEAGVDLVDGVLIVSNGFHLTRARMLAGRAGFENISTLAAPSSHVPSRLKMYIREPLALVKSFVFDR